MARNQGLSCLWEGAGQDSCTGNPPGKLWEGKGYGGSSGSGELPGKPWDLRKISLDCRPQVQLQCLRKASFWDLNHETRKSNGYIIPDNALGPGGLGSDQPCRPPRPTPSLSSGLSLPLSTGNSRGLLGVLPHLPLAQALSLLIWPFPLLLLSYQAQVPDHMKSSSEWSSVSHRAQILANILLHLFFQLQKYIYTYRHPFLFCLIFHLS